MTKSRLEAFSDGVLAIVITIMVLEMKIPHGSALQDLKPLFPVFISYVISFAFIAVYWGNHHHLLHSAHRVNSRIIWSNMLLLFFLSLIPFSSGWMGENHFEKVPVALYAFNLLLCAIAYYLLQNAILMDLPESNLLVQALKKQKKKGILSVSVYLLAIPIAFFSPIISSILFVGISVIWIIPDRNIEKALRENQNQF
jgi:uncharacterized membrane protein